MEPSGGIVPLCEKFEPKRLVSSANRCLLYKEQDPLDLLAGERGVKIILPF